jgi:hypothetical protein
MALGVVVVSGHKTQDAKSEKAEEKAPPTLPPCCALLFSVFMDDGRAAMGRSAPSSRGSREVMYRALGAGWVPPDPSWLAPALRVSLS